MSECELVEITDEAVSGATPELRALVEDARERIGMRTFRHTESEAETMARAVAAGGRKTSPRILTVTLTVENHDLEDAHLNLLGIRRWRHVGVGVYGSLQARLRDHAKIGRKRRPGERAPVPLPDWFDLSHIVYDHPELGFDRTRAVWQYLPPPTEEYLNIAEVLHLRQPA